MNPQPGLQPAKDKLQEECGVFGIYSSEKKDVAKYIYYGLYALQHRGQESAGIVTTDGISFKSFVGMGLVPVVFSKEEIFRELKGRIGLGHTRYSTTGSSVICNAQPIIANTPFGTIALAHNGNLTNTKELQKKLRKKGYGFKGNSDSEVICAMLSFSKKKDLCSALVSVLKKLKGAFSIGIMTNDRLIAVRDPHGIRPLCIGHFDNCYIVSSETCGLDILGAKLVKEIKPGEMAVINKKGIKSMIWSKKQPSLCVFEFIYFARPDSVMNGRNLYHARVDMGRYLAKEHPVEADYVIPVPDSGNPAAIGFASKSKIPFSDVLVKNRYVGRTFIQPTQDIRELGVKLKLNPIKEVIRGKNIVLIDDSIVRGTTSRQIVRILKEAGAKKVHVRVASPPIIGTCSFGIDTATKKELIASSQTVEKIRKYLGADSLGYLSMDGLIKAIALPKDSLCLGCLNLDYPN
ncbi:MAG: amidophosphoribosyltransferase [Candidatus Saganbacteria bacterium]|nr:amidophosphoribosyltransferase [Candidatus Saganbacteria bacterium]